MHPSSIPFRSEKATSNHVNQMTAHLRLDHSHGVHQLQHAELPLVSNKQKRAGASLKGKALEKWMQGDSRISRLA